MLTLIASGVVSKLKFKNIYQSNPRLQRLQVYIIQIPVKLDNDLTMGYIYIVWRYVCHNSSACHTYVMWEELGHSHFLYVPTVSNVVTTGNGMGTKNVLKWNRVLWFVYSNQFSVYGATTIVKVSFFSTWTWSTVSFHSMLSVDINLYSCEQTSVI